MDNQAPPPEMIFGNYMAWKLDEKTWVISFMEGTEYLYLLEGEEKALLLDTGYGIGHLRAFVEKLTDRAVCVANTHFHPDHSAGNGEWEEVLLSEGWTVDAPSVCNPGAGPCDLSSLPYPYYRKTLLHDGDVIDLGGRRVRVLEALPAHCNSSLFFYDAGNNMLFSSANSINWGRLLPQIVYYISAYCDLVNDGKIEFGDKINVVVPTGNFGNILASYYASLMGLPINKFICASNSNNVLTDFINTGVYDKNRHFYTTMSPSMDILVSSNLERLLYKLSGDSDETTRAWMNALKTEGKYEVTDEVKALMQEKFFGGFCDDGQTQATINRLFKEDNYLCDTHTAVAVNVYEQYVSKTGDTTPSIIASTASPYKFSRSVLEAVSPDGILPINEFDMVDKLNELTGMPVPAPLANLKDKKARFSDVTEANEMPAYVLKALSIE